MWKVERPSCLAEEEARDYQAKKSSSKGGGRVTCGAPGLEETGVPRHGAIKGDWVVRASAIAWLASLPGGPLAREFGAFGSAPSDRSQYCALPKSGEVFLE